MRQNRHYQIFWLMCNSVGGFGLAIGVHNFKLSDTHWIWSLWKNLGSNPIAKFPYPYTTDLMHNIHVQKHLPYCLSSIWQPCRGGHGSEVPESTPAGFCAFLSDPDPDQESMFCEKPDQKSLFNFGSSRSLCVHFFSKNMGKFRLDGWW